jgi:RNA polymerase sigma factor (sigma-70 family)
VVVRKDVMVGGPAFVRRTADTDEDRPTARPRSGSDGAPPFAMVYQAHAGAILRYCRVRIGNPADAENAAAQVFARALAAYPPDDPGKIRSWLFAIAHNVIANHYRTTAARAPAQPLDEALSVPDAGLTPDEITERREERAVLLDAIAELTDDQRQVVELRLAGLTGLEIADATGRTHAAVKMLQYRAMRNLRVLLALAEQNSIVIKGERSKENNHGV